MRRSIDDVLMGLFDNDDGAGEMKERRKRRESRGFLCSWQEPPDHQAHASSRSQRTW